MLLRVYLLSFILQFTSSTVNRDLKISSGLDEVSRESVAMQFYIQMNNTGNDCQVECFPDRCCLEIGGEENCDVLQMIGGCFQNVPAGGSRTVRLAAPLLEPFGRRGYCVVHLKSKPKGYAVCWDTLTIPFETERDADVTPCPSIDQDPLNDCQPVDCDTYYNGQKPYYSKRRRRCLKTPPCTDLMYDARSNKCVQQISDEDIRLIKSSISKKRRRKNTSVYSSVDAAEDELARSVKAMNTKRWDTYLPVQMCLSWSSTAILYLVIIMQCSFVITLYYWASKRCICFKKQKKIVDRFFFNYRQADSDMTPLISSHCGTMTICQFESESSSNVDKKIKCYKACHKDKLAKSSMSDDILSRCLKRRDWIRKPKSSDVIPENKEGDKYGVQVPRDKVYTKWADNKAYRPVCGMEFVPAKSMPGQIASEQEMTSFDYENKDANVKTENEKIENASQSEVKGKIYLSPSGKSAQACFSKDSLDDFLSERGLIYLPDEASKYTLSSGSTTYNMISGSSKTSKDPLNAMLHRNPGPASDPGGGKSEDLELLHMSRVSMFSSSDDSDYTNLKIMKVSRTSL